MFDNEESTNVVGKREVFGYGQTVSWRFGGGEKERGIRTGSGEAVV